MYIYLRNLRLKVRPDLYILLQFTFIFSLIYFLVFSLFGINFFCLFSSFFLLLSVPSLIYRSIFYHFLLHLTKHPIIFFFYLLSVFFQIFLFPNLVLILKRTSSFLKFRDSSLFPFFYLYLSIYRYNSSLTIILRLLIR